MKKKVCIVVEVANRELDNALLLKCELEHRGYDVKIMNKTEQIALRKNDVLLIPNCYNTEDYEFYRYRFNCETGKIICMQYEQILSQKIIESGFYSPKGRAETVTHLCWGENAFRRLRKDGIEEFRLKKVGAVQLDTTRKEFNSYWETRESLAKKYNIPLEKKWMLYISSFTCTGDDLIKQRLLTIFKDEMVDEFKVIAANSQVQTLAWFDKFLTEQKDVVVIYRPHPVELKSTNVANLVKKHPDSFISLQDLSIKQWIKVSDIISTWFSTSIVESYAMNKNCIIIRPYEIPIERECDIYKSCNAVESYEEFKTAINNYMQDVAHFPISIEVINDYYKIDDYPSYMQICDQVDEMNSGEGSLEKRFVKNRICFLLKHHIVLKVCFKAIYKFLYKYFNFKINNKKLRNKFFIEEWEKSVENTINSKEEIEAKEQCIKNIIHIRKVENV